MTVYDKPVLTSCQHIEQWQARGLQVPDLGRACHYLEVISYYRFSAYSVPFQHGNPRHQFREGSGFDDLIDLYIFDRELRLLILDAVERIEVALRASMTNVLAEHHGSHAYLDALIFDTRYNHDWLLTQIERKCADHKVEPFIDHYRRKYTEPSLPPIWMVLEILTFKEVSVLFSHLRLKDDKQALSQFWGVPDVLLRSWFRALSDLRNVCAHHSRVWNREFGSRPKQSRKPLPHWPDMSAVVIASAQGQQSIEPSNRLYGLLVVTEFLLKRVNPSSDWHGRLFALIQKHSKVSKAHMGMPEDWHKEPFWRLTTD